MLTLLRHLDGTPTAIREATTGIASLVVAEAYFKFHSFTLECLAFLATWTILSGITELCRRLATNPSAETSVS